MKLYKHEWKFTMTRNAVRTIHVAKALDTSTVIVHGITEHVHLKMMLYVQ